MDLKNFRERSDKERREEPNLSQERERTAIREENLKTSSPVVWPLSEMIIIASPLNFVQVWDILEELLEETFKFNRVKIVILCSIHAV